LKSVNDNGKGQNMVSTATDIADLNRIQREIVQSKNRIAQNIKGIAHENQTKALKQKELDQSQDWPGSQQPTQKRLRRAMDSCDANIQRYI
jgi:uncharacterized protein (UPF0261 family)